MQDIELANEKHLSSEPVYRNVYRGFAFENYGGREIVRYLFGDWKHMIASHTFTKQLAQKVRSGRYTFHEALHGTAKEIAATVAGEIERDGLLSYMQAQSRGTWLAIKKHKKSATAMASYPGDPFVGQIPTPSPFSYAATGYHGIAGRKVLKQTDALIVLEVDQRPLTIKTGEPQIISHIPPTKIRRVFLGYSDWYNIKLNKHPKMPKENWFALEVLGRDELGRPLDIRINPIHRTRHGNINESWTLDGSEGWQATQAHTTEAKAFEAKYPRLATTLKAAHSQVRARDRQAQPKN